MPYRINKKIKIGVMGGNGLLGSDLIKYLSLDFNVDSITKDNYQDKIGTRYDIFINANGNSKRFWANQNVIKDFEASTISVYKTIFEFKHKKYIYISSSDVYENHTKALYTNEDQIINSDKLCSYGFHKFLSESIVRNNTKDYLILRSCMILGNNLRKGPFYDILHDQPIFITLDSKLQVILTKEIANIIKLLIQKSVKNEIINMGGIGVFHFKNIKKYVNKKITISREANKQEYEMDVTKLTRIYSLKTSEEYVKKFINNLNI